MTDGQTDGQTDRRLCHPIRPFWSKIRFVLILYYIHPAGLWNYKCYAGQKWNLLWNWIIVLQGTHANIWNVSFNSANQRILCMNIVRLALKRRLGFAFGMYRLVCHDDEANSDAAFLVTSCRQAGFLLHIQTHKTQ